MPTEELDVPDEDVWAHPPDPDDEEEEHAEGEDESGQEDERPDTAEQVLDRSMDRMEKR